MKLAIIIFISCLVVYVLSIDDDENKDGILIYNGEINLVGFANNSARVSAFLDHKAKLICVVGQNGETVLWDLEQDTLIYTVTDPNHEGKETFQAYFDNMTSLSDLKEKAQIHSLLSVLNNQKVLKLINLVCYNVGYKVREISSEGLHIIQRNAAMIKESLEIYKLLFRGKGSIDGISADMNRAATVIFGIQKLFESGDLKQLNEIKFDLGGILKSGNGLEALLCLLEAIQDSIDLSKLTGSATNDQERILKVIVLFTTGIHTGIDGFFNVLYNIVSLIRGHVDLDTVIQSIRDFFAGGGISDFDLNKIEEICVKILDILKKQESVFHSALELSNLRQLLEAFKNNNFSIFGNNLSEVIDLIILGKPTDITQIIVKLINSFPPHIGYK